MPFLTTNRFSEFGTYTEDKVVYSKLQITDLFPNKSQSSAVITPNFQGPYNFRPVNVQNLLTLPVLDVALDITTEVSGLAAYFLAVVEDDANTTHITPAQSVLIATAIIDAMKVGGSLRLAEIDTIIAGVVGAGSELTNAGGSESTGTVLQVLEILCGAKTFTLPVGHSVGDDGNANAFTPFADAGTQAAAFTAIAGYTSIPSTHNSFYLSARSGQIKTAQLSLKTINNYAQPVLVAYDDDGSVVK